MLWRGASGAVASFEDRCPHRGARLSLGRVQGDALECPYHGWRFGADGGCVRVPAAPGHEAPQRACTWAAAPAHGLWWVAPAGTPGGPPELPAGLPSRQVLCGPYDVRTSAPRVVENFLDTAQFAFVHAGRLGERGHAEVPDYRVSLDESGRPAVTGYRAWQPQASLTARAGAWVRYDYRVLAPYAALLHKQAEGDAAAEAYALFCCPLDDESTRVWFTLHTSDSSSNDAELRAFQDAVFAEDRPVLESQRPKRLPLSGKTEAAGPADRLSVAYRRYLATTGVRCGIIR